LKYLIDTNVLSELSKKMPNPDVVACVDALPRDGVYISVVTLGEIIKGIEKTRDSVKKEQFANWYKKIRTVFDGKIIDIDEGIMTEWGKLVVSCDRTLPALDSLIAATCICNNYVLLTRNEKDFEDIPNLVVQNPWRNIVPSKT
jgi:predicted nucleic acid-binding protein